MKLIRTARPPRHVYHRPGWWKRRRLGIREGGRIQCECGQIWEWRDLGWEDFWPVWVRIDADGKAMWGVSDLE